MAQRCFFCMALHGAFGDVLGALFSRFLLPWRASERFRFRFGAFFRQKLTWAPFLAVHRYINSRAPFFAVPFHSPPATMCDLNAPPQEEADVVVEEEGPRDEAHDIVEEEGPPGLHFSLILV
jgi:hypothetical protein